MVIKLPEYQPQHFPSQQQAAFSTTGSQLEGMAKQGLADTIVRGVNVLGNLFLDHEKNMRQLRADTISGALTAYQGQLSTLAEQIRDMPHTSLLGGAESETLGGLQTASSNTAFFDKESRSARDKILESIQKQDIREEVKGYLEQMHDATFSEVIRFDTLRTHKMRAESFIENVQTMVEHGSAGALAALASVNLEAGLDPVIVKEIVGKASAELGSQNLLRRLRALRDLYGHEAVMGFAADPDAEFVGEDGEITSLNRIMWHEGISVSSDGEVVERTSVLPMESLANALGTLGQEEKNRLTAAKAILEEKTEELKNTYWTLLKTQNIEMTTEALLKYISASERELYRAYGEKFGLSEFDVAAKVQMEGWLDAAKQGRVRTPAQEEAYQDLFTLIMQAGLTADSKVRAVTSNPYVHPDDRGPLYNMAKSAFTSPLLVNAMDSIKAYYQEQALAKKNAKERDVFLAQGRQEVRDIQDSLLTFYLSHLERHGPEGLQEAFDHEVDRVLGLRFQKIFTDNLTGGLRDTHVSPYQDTGRFYDLIRAFEDGAFARNTPQNIETTALTRNSTLVVLDKYMADYTGFKQEPPIRLPSPGRSGRDPQGSLRVIEKTGLPIIRVVSPAMFGDNAIHDAYLTVNEEGYRIMVPVVTPENKGHAKMLILMRPTGMKPSLVGEAEQKYWDPVTFAEEQLGVSR